MGEDGSADERNAYYLAACRRPFRHVCRHPARREDFRDGAVARPGADGHNRHRFDADPASVRPDQADIEYLLEALNRVLRRPLAASDVVGSFAGLRALAVQPGRSPSANTREYRFHRGDLPKNFISVCGGKLTTARALGEKLVDIIASELGPGGSRRKARSLHQAGPTSRRTHRRARHFCELRSLGMQ